MKNIPDIIYLNDMNALLPGVAGGKFTGLVKANPHIRLNNIIYDFDLRIPETYAITLNAFKRYNIGKCGVPDSLVDAASRTMDKCGGNVAVRSSANIEDLAGKTCSGAFKSVLSVQSRPEMKDALNTVYESLYNERALQQCKKSDLAMGIIIQEMLQPSMAGVAYSETWYKMPFDVIKYVENDVADKLVSGDGECGQDFAVSKFNQDSELFNLANLNDNSYNVHFLTNPYEPLRAANSQDRVQYANLFKVAALANTLEQQLSSPVDMEFAIDKNNRLNILQVRPYVLPTFYQNPINKQITSVFAPGREILTGHAYFIEDRGMYPILPENAKIVIYQDEHSIRFFTPKSFVDTLMYPLAHTNPFAAQYNHYGNMTRENLDFTTLEIYRHNADFAHLKNGDFLNINLLTGKVIVQKSR